MEVVHIMTKHPETIGPNDTLAKALEMMEAGGFRRLPVVEGRELIGILTERDLRQHRGHLESTKVSAAMSAPVNSVGPHSTVQQASRLILHKGVGGLPVVDNGYLIGIITTTDLIRAFLEVVDDYEEKRAGTGAAAPQRA